MSLCIVQTGMEDGLLRGLGGNEKTEQNVNTQHTQRALKQLYVKVKAT